MNLACISPALLLALAALMLAGNPVAFAAESNVVAEVKEAGSNEALRAYLELQEQLHTTQQSLERNRVETERLAAQNAEQLKTLERALDSERDRSIQALNSANQQLLMVAGSFAVIGFIAMLLTAYLQWRAVNRLTEFTALLPGAGRVALAGQAESRLLGSSVAEQANSRLFGALSTLEKRILELEHATHLPLTGKSLPANGVLANEPVITSGPAEQVALLLAKGESLLNLDKAEEALACYDEILAQHPEHPEALVKKGAALEQLRKTDDALRCYDRAIAADGSLTVAYLQKGGLFNRLERYEEALQCYEQALRTQEKAREA
jgi:tetratricopeptide (TPR) repeat protein